MQSSVFQTTITSRLRWHVFSRDCPRAAKVLSITISQGSLWEKPVTEPTTLEYLAPHICLESRKSSLAQAQNIRRFPIDLATFLNIDTGQVKTREIQALTDWCLDLSWRVYGFSVQLLYWNLFEGSGWTWTSELHLWTTSGDWKHGRVDSPHLSSLSFRLWGLHHWLTLKPYAVSSMPINN